MKAKVVIEHPRYKEKEIILPEKVLLQLQENRKEASEKRIQKQDSKNNKKNGLLQINEKWRIKACKVIGQDRVVEIMCKQLTQNYNTTKQPVCLTNNFKKPSTKLDNTSYYGNYAKKNIELY